LVGRGDSAVTRPNAAVPSMRRYCHGRAHRLNDRPPRSPPVNRRATTISKHTALGNAYGIGLSAAPRRSRRAAVRTPLLARPGRLRGSTLEFFCAAGGAPCKAMLIAALQCATFRQMHWSVPAGGTRGAKFPRRVPSETDR
jgi:hypothetical protein